MVNQKSNTQLDANILLAPKWYHTNALLLVQPVTIEILFYLIVQKHVVLNEQDL